MRFSWPDPILFLLLGESAADDISSVESLQYDFSSIRAATSDFDNTNKLGQGGFGAVYKVTKYCTSILISTILNSTKLGSFCSQLRGNCKPAKK